jgi:hypothetical protein
MPAEQPSFRQVQQAMTAWLREPERMPPPDVEMRRLTIYRELIVGNILDFVETAYPVLKSLLPAEEWSALFNRFFIEHRCQTPYFREISLEFRQWVEATQTGWLATRPWAQELLHFEWVGLAADCADVPPDTTACQPDGDLLAGIPCIKEAVWPLVYRWPVHTLSEDNPPDDTPPAELTCLLVYRDDDEELETLEVNPLSARLVELIQAGEARSGRDLLLQLAAETGYTEATAQDVFVEAGTALLQQLHERGVIRGTRLNAI